MFDTKDNILSFKNRIFDVKITILRTTNIVLPTIRKFSEQAKKDDFARSMAARGIAQNIATNAALTQGMAQATRQMGQRAAEQAGSALTTQYNY